MIHKLIKPVIALSLALAVSLPSQAETLKAGSSPTGVPFTFLDTKTNTIEGVIVDLSQAIANDQGIEIEVEGMPFSTLIPSLMSSKIDIVAAALGITDKRKEVVDFTSPVYSYGEGLVVNAKDTKNYRKISDLKGAVIGVQVGTVYVEPLKKAGQFKEIKYYNSLADVINDVKLGRIKAGFGDYPIVAYQINQGDHTGVRLVKNYESMVDVKIALAVRKGDTETLRKLNFSLAKLKENGRFDKIITKWGL